MKKRTIIFTDLDGTLLDPQTYSYEAAMPALEQVRARGIPLVIVSSKTRAEIEMYRQRLQNVDPFISENGGGIFVPEGYFPFAVPGERRDGYIIRSLGIPYRKSRGHLREIRRRRNAQVKGFGDLSAEAVAELTGLAPEEAVLAKRRDFSEPFVFSGATDEAFLQAIEEAGLHWTQGKLFHIMGDHDKGRAVQMVSELYARRDGATATIGLGDGLNDLPFLRVVDRPVLIKREDGSHDPRIDVPGLLRTEGIGPAGWNEAVNRIMESD